MRAISRTVNDWRTSLNECKQINAKIEQNEYIACLGAREGRDDKALSVGLDHKMTIEMRQ